MNKYQRHNWNLSNELSDTISDIKENYSMGLIDPIEYINQICTISQAIKADIRLPIENWAIIRLSTDYVVMDLFETAMEAANELNKWENKEQFKIDKV